MTEIRTSKTEISRKQELPLKAKYFQRENKILLCLNTDIIACAEQDRPVVELA